MQVAYPEPTRPVHPGGGPVTGGHRPTPIDLLAAGLLAATVVLHVVAMFPHYFGGPGQPSLWSQPDQAAEYAILAAGWALALGIGLSSPARARVAAALAVGVGATELGFRLADLGQVFRYGTSQGAGGLWLMTIAWVVGASGAAAAVIAVHHRAGTTRLAPAGHGVVGPGGSVIASDEAAGAGAVLAGGLADFGPADADPAATAEPPGAAAEPPGATAEPPGAAAEPPGAAAEPPGAAAAPAASVPPPAPTEIPPASPTEPPPYGPGAVVLVGVLALATAGAFLPAWDHYSGVASATGRSISFSLGNAFAAPWQVVLGTVLAGLALAAIPILAMRIRDRVVGAAVVAGSLIVLASQLTAAIVQIDEPVPSSVAGLNATQAGQLGLQLHLTLSGWFTVDLLAAFALFLVTMVLAHARFPEEDSGAVQASSAGSWPSAPDSRRAASLPWS